MGTDVAFQMWNSHSTRSVECTCTIHGIPDLDRSRSTPDFSLRGRRVGVPHRNSRLQYSRCCYFGDDVLQVSTLRGKGNCRGLDPHKLKSLLTEVHGFPYMTQEDFAAKVQMKIKQAL